MIEKFFSSLKNSFLHLVYPHQCLHCQEMLDPNEPLFCYSCSCLLEWINPEERCSRCFSADHTFSRNSSKHCLQKTALIYRQAAALEYIGPAATLVKQLKYGNRPYLARGGSALLFAQFDRLKWPLPDAIIPVPLSLTHWLQRGYNQSALLAENMANFLNIPVWDVLKRKSGDYSQAGLNLEQRKRLDGKHFKLKSGYSLEDKVLLLVDDVMTSGSTLNRCAEALAEGVSARIYALTLCSA